MVMVSGGDGFEGTDRCVTVMLGGESVCGGGGIGGGCDSSGDGCVMVCLLVVINGVSGCGFGGDQEI